MSSLYLDGELRAEDRARVQAHLRACPACLAVFRQTLELARRARDLPRRVPHADLVACTRAALAQRRSVALADLEWMEPRSTTTERRARLAATVGVWIAIAATAFVLGRWTAPAAAPAPEPAAGAAPSGGAPWRPPDVDAARGAGSGSDPVEADGPAAEPRRGPGAPRDEVERPLLEATPASDRPGRRSR